MATQKTLGTKVKKKSFVPVMAPHMFGDILIGETPVAEAKSLIGKRVSANFMQLTNDFKRQHITLRFQVSGIKEGKAHTIITGFELAPSYIKRLVRRGRTKVPDSFTIVSQDGVTVRVKPLMITQTRVSSRIATLLRLSLKSQFADIASKENFSALAAHFLDGSLQRHFRQNLSKIATLKHFEMKAFLAVGDAKESDVLLEGARPRQEVQVMDSVETPIESSAEEEKPAVEAVVPKKRAKKAASEASEA